MLGCMPSGVRLDGSLSSSFQLYCRKQQQGRLPLSSARACAGLDKGGGEGHSDLESSSSAVSSASLPPAPKAIKDCNSCGGANQAAAIATKNGAIRQHAPTESASDNKTSSFPGIISPPMKTVGKSTNIVWQQCMVKREERQKLLRQKGCVIWITGLSGSGKSTLACTLDHALLKRGNLTYVLDGDNLRHGLNNNLGFSAEDRAENIRRIGEVSKLFVDGGVVCIVSCISPFRKDRDACRKLIPPGEFIEVFMDFPLQLCEQRDPKGLYKLARAGKIKGFTGVDDPYEAPIDCEVVFRPVDGKCPTPADMAEELISRLEDAGFLGFP